MSYIDLRSDTVTRPTEAMRAHMSTAPVGDDQYGDDPSVNALQEQVAELLGKEAALWFPTGTLANQASLRLLTRPGDDIVVAREAHSVWHEAGGSGANAGVQLTEIGTRGTFSADDFKAAIKPANGPFPPTTLVQMENTHNRMSGVVLPQADAVAVCEAAREAGIPSYLDGARLWNAATASGRPVAELARPFDMVMVSLSKGLGAPGGSLVAGPADKVKGLVRHRRMLGGAMRQIGFFAAAGSFAIDNHFERLEEDHENARMIAERVANFPGVTLDLSRVETNIVNFDMADHLPDAQTVIAAMRAEGVLVGTLGKRKIRMLTHLDVDFDDCMEAVDKLAAILKG